MAIIGVLLLALSLAVASSASATWYDTDDRDTISLVSATADISESMTSGLGGVLTYEVNVTLPMLISELDNTSTYFAFQSTADNGTTHTFTLNGVAVQTDVVTANQSWSNTTLADAITAGVDDGDTWLLFNITVNVTGWTGEVALVADDGAITSAWLTSSSTLSEEDNGTSVPEIDGKWTVRDRLVINNTLDFNLSDFDLNFEYPDTLFDGSAATWENDTALPVGETSIYVIYRKHGPSIDLDDEDTASTSGATLTNTKLTLTFTSEDKLENAIWDTTDGDNVYETYLSGIDEDSDLVVTVNGDEVDENDIDIQEDTILFEDLPDIDADDDNTIVFEWNAPSSGGSGTTTPPTTPPADEEEGFLYEEAVSGLPNWALLTIIAVIIIALLAIRKIEK